jgi:hypothetical protein
MSKTLKRDIYNLCAPGFPIEKVETPDPDPLAGVKYSCVYWVDHLHDCDHAKYISGELCDNGLVDVFLHESYLCWLEALSLLRSMSQGMLAIVKLKELLRG